MRYPRLHYWQGAAGQWHWHLKGANGRIVLQGDPDGYRSARDCLRAIRRAQVLMTLAQIDADPTVRKAA